MQIRTITAGAREADVERAAHAAQVARERLIAAGYMVQTLRLALTATGSNRCGDFQIWKIPADGGEILATLRSIKLVSMSHPVENCSGRRTRHGVRAR